LVNVKPEASSLYAILDKRTWPTIEFDSSHMLLAQKIAAAPFSAVESFLRICFALLLVGCSALLTQGCSSTGKPSSARFASVEIQGNTPGQIRDATIEVFRANGYSVTHAKLDQMVFEIKGGGWSNFAYGNWSDDKGVWVRVKASIVPVSEETFRLQCHAYMIRDRNGSTEEEIALTNLQSHSYQKLMNEVAARFHPGNSATK
jgi:hypothetical protein